MPWNRDTARDYADLGPQHHVAILRSVIPDLLGRLDGARVLDFGCGPGRLATALAEMGAGGVVGLDESRDMVEQARAEVERSAGKLRDRIVIEHGSESDLAALGDFDAALSSLALMMCASRDRLRSVARGLVRALRPGGRLVVVLTHPCFRRRDYGTFRYELPDDYDYWRSGIAYDVHLTPKTGHDDAVITDYHWMLEDYCDALITDGAVLTSLTELPAGFRDDGSPAGPPAYIALRFERRRSSTVPMGRNRDR